MLILKEKNRHIIVIILKNLISNARKEIYLFSITFFIKF